MIKCPKCGKELPKEARFCPYCMYRFIEDKNIMPIDYTTVNNLVVNNKAKRYILLASVIFICVITMVFIVYGNIVRKSLNDNNRNNTYSSEFENVQSDDEETTTMVSNHVEETTSSEIEQMAAISKPTKPVIIPTTEQMTESTAELDTEPTTEPKEEHTTEVSKSDTPSTEESTNSDVCQHIYTSVTCTAPAICVLCGIVAYEALGHDGVATCTKEGICSRCGVLVEKAFGHNFINRTCSSGGVCSVCGVKGTIALKHEFADVPICKEAKCNNCDYVREAQSDCCYENTPCYEYGKCVYCGEIGVKYHKLSDTGSCYDCDFASERFEMKEAGETFNITPERWMNVTVGGNYKFDIIKDKNSEYYGKTVVGIPITYDKLLGVEFFLGGDYTGFIEGYDNKYFRTPFVSEYFEDGFQLIALREEKAVTEYYYILYGGDGEYKLQFNDDPDNSHGKIVIINIKK